MTEPTDTAKTYENEESLLRDDQYRRLLELKEKQKLLDIVISEGSAAEEFQSKSDFWPILKRTLEAMRYSANSDAHKASRDSRSEISHFLGREESFDDIFNVIHEFTIKADNAETEKNSIEEEIAQLTQILATPETNTQDVGGAMG